MPKNLELLRSLFSSALLAACSLSASVSCGYRNIYSDASPQTVNIPYVDGDSDGSCTNARVREVEKTGILRYVPRGGTLTLRVDICDEKELTIGYRYTSRSKTRVRADEARAQILAEVRLIDSTTGLTIAGPAYIFAKNDFDHEYYAPNQNTNRFSLGQLSDIDTAHEVSSLPLYRHLSENIAAWLLTQEEVILAHGKQTQQITHPLSEGNSSM